MTEFDELSKGEQFLRLRRIDYEVLIADARLEINHSHYLLEHYPNAYTIIDKERILVNIKINKKDIEYYSELIGGAENEEFLTESQKDSESPNDRYTGPSCITV